MQIINLIEKIGHVFLKINLDYNIEGSGQTSVSEVKRVNAFLASQAPFALSFGIISVIGFVLQDR